MIDGTSIATSIASGIFVSTLAILAQWTYSRWVRRQRKQQAYSAMRQAIERFEQALVDYSMGLEGPGGMGFIPAHTLWFWSFKSLLESLEIGLQYLLSPGVEDDKYRADLANLIADKQRLWRLLEPHGGVLEPKLYYDFLEEIQCVERIGYRRQS